MAVVGFIVAMLLAAAMGTDLSGVLVGGIGAVFSVVLYGGCVFLWYYVTSAYRLYRQDNQLLLDLNIENARLVSVVESLQAEIEAKPNVTGRLSNLKFLFPQDGGLGGFRPVANSKFKVACNLRLNNLGPPSVFQDYKMRMEINGERISLAPVFNKNRAIKAHMSARTIEYKPENLIRLQTQDTPIETGGSIEGAIVFQVVDALPPALWKECVAGGVECQAIVSCKDAHGANVEFTRTLIAEA